jgi:hypothetical protein
MRSVCRFSIAVTVQWTTASIARSCSDPLNQVPAKNQAYVPTNFLLPICLHVSVATGVDAEYCNVHVRLQDAQVGSLIQIGTNQVDNVCALI